MLTLEKNQPTDKHCKISGYIALWRTGGSTCWVSARTLEICARDELGLLVSSPRAPFPTPPSFSSFTPKERYTGAHCCSSSTCWMAIPRWCSGAPILEDPCSHRSYRLSITPSSPFAPILRAGVLSVQRASTLLRASSMSSCLWWPCGGCCPALVRCTSC